MSKFQEWFDMMQDVGEHCGTSLGQWHMELMESAWDASREELKAENESLQQSNDELRKLLAMARLHVSPTDPLRLRINAELFTAALISSPENPS